MMKDCIKMKSYNSYFVDKDVLPWGSLLKTHCCYGVNKAINSNCGSDT